MSRDRQNRVMNEPGATRNMRLVILAAGLLAAGLSIPALPVSAGDLDLMVGLRSVIAAAIRDDGYNCPDVKRMIDLGPDKWGSVLKITCGPVGGDESWD